MKRKRNSFLCFVVLLISVGAVRSQDTVQFSIDAFYRQVAEFHPMVRQARLLSEQARQEIRFARGSFDPKLEASFATKEFQDKSYFSTFETALTLPTRSPLQPKVGFERTTGELLDPSEKIPGNEQAFAGVSLQLGRGLLTDERRTVLRQAEQMVNMFEAEQVKLVNKILLEAASAYWNWYYRYRAETVFDRAATVSQEILDGVKLNFSQGEASVLDTVQSSITNQARQIEKQEARLQLKNAKIALSNFLWADGNSPIMLSANAVPLLPVSGVIRAEEELAMLSERARENHPELIKLRTKIEILELDQRLAREFLKPRLDLNYALLSQPGAAQSIDLSNDYKLGLDFSFPLFLRKERSKLKLMGLKLNQTNLETGFLEREILNTLQQTFNELITMQGLLSRQFNMVKSYERLMEGELLNLRNGESDLFKINVQQEKLLQSQEKLAKLESDYQKRKAYLWWSAGISPLDSTAPRQ